MIASVLDEKKDSGSFLGRKPIAETWYETKQNSKISLVATVQIYFYSLNGSAHTSYFALCLLFWLRSPCVCIQICFSFF